VIERSAVGKDDDGHSPDIAIGVLGLDFHSLTEVQLRSALLGPRAEGLGALGGSDRVDRRPEQHPVVGPRTRPCTTSRADRPPCVPCVEGAAGFTYDHVTPFPSH
jgi:hypothetical protein